MGSFNFGTASLLPQHYQLLLCWSSLPPCFVSRDSYSNKNICFYGLILISPCSMDLIHHSNTFPRSFLRIVIHQTPYDVALALSLAHLHREQIVLRPNSFYRWCYDPSYFCLYPTTWCVCPGRHWIMSGCVALPKSFSYYMLRRCFAGSPLLCIALIWGSFPLWLLCYFPFFFNCCH